MEDREARQVCITTDNGSNIVKAVSLNKWKRLQCFGHRLHLERSMKDSRIDRAVGVCKKVVSSFSFSWKKRRDLGTAQQELNLPAHQLISESPTRWGSRAKMIERVLEQERAISQVLAADKKTRHLVLTWQDLEVLDILAIQDDDTALTQSIKVSILDYLREKFDDPATNDLLDMAGLVDPRVQLSHLLHNIKHQQYQSHQKENPWKLLQKGNNILCHIIT
ncbi:Zinc finger BED domain containing protein 4 [Dissostichus eleginoides]|uniref:Zinc finger BED domain containing protein 4 n=1 Tax=Dissostichus eleginoides TaxID=100907 RepID=A0AAD9FG88_DISEL|nr:Zinc finger BED domain containing protein 4 [Dissostichus eleginoides]